jgi:hypothetical protein
MARRRKSRKTSKRSRKSSKRRVKKTASRRTRKAAKRKVKGRIPLDILEKRAGRLVRLVHKRGGKVK